MATALTQDIRVKFGCVYTNALDLTTTDDSLAKQYKWTTTNGTGTDQADQLWHDTRTLAAGATDNLDLAGGVTNAFGTTMTFAKVKGVFIKNNSTTSGEYFTVGNATAPVQLWFGATTGTELLQHDACTLHVNNKSGWTVTAATGDTLKIVNSGTASNTYDIIIWGTSA